MHFELKFCLLIFEFMIHVGQILFDARSKKGLTLEDVSKAIKIKPQFLSAIEKGEYNKLPSRAYAQGFVRNYIEYLGLPEKETMALFRREFDEEKIYRVLPEGLVGRQDFSIHRTRLSRTIVTIVILLLLLVTYIFYQNRYAFLAPPLEVTSPKEGVVLNGSSVQIIGKTDSNVTVYINNNAVFLEEKGMFKKTVDVFLGKSIIVIRAVNRFGKETKIERHVEVK